MAVLTTKDVQCVTGARFRTARGGGSRGAAHFRRVGRQGRRDRHLGALSDKTAEIDRTPTPILSGRAWRARQSSVNNS